MAGDSESEKIVKAYRAAVSSAIGPNVYFLFTNDHN